MNGGSPIISSLGLAILGAVWFVTPARAAINIEYVSVGNPFNYGGLHGLVRYAYQIGKYEVTNAQYAAFLNAKGSSNSYGIYNSKMSSYGIAQIGSSGSYTYSVTSGFENRPVVFVSWYDAARFTNWLGNGQGDGSMETGAYTLDGNTGIITVNVGATVYIPGEDEWYKAAYYNGDTSTYSRYPNGQNSITTAEANYNNSVGHSTNVGSYGVPSFYGTFDQGGNVFEWNDRVYSGSSGLMRGNRGGSWANLIGPLSSSLAFYSDPSKETFDVGFRVASIIPEPSCMVLAIFASGTMFIRRKR